MHHFRSVLFVFILFICCSKLAQSQEQPQKEPFVISVIPDSLFIAFEYSQVYSFYVVGSMSSYGTKPTDTMDKLKEKIVDKCKEMKFDGFLLQNIAFGREPEWSSIFAWGTFLRLKNK
jgi:hypothetical protein